MGLIKVKNLTYSDDGTTFLLDILIPKGTKLDALYINNQDVVVEHGRTDYGNQIIVQDPNSWRYFYKLFILDSDGEETIDGIVYSLFHFDGTKYATFITVNPKDLTFIHMHLDITDASVETKKIIYSGDCKDYSETTVATLYDIMPLKFKALRLAKFEDCDVPNEFVDAILRLKVLELAIEFCDYCKAAEYWQMLTKGKDKNQDKKCGCHG